ncbi:c-type cytochrome [Wenyingzhuangia sp. 2_MG-2023]|uniref:c-type cytochrome n=1 Tax=Wenyingzhuangia sp. 2_MG-2023 TaxID=3062639 RepID=UPI0026E48B2C|nr:c-type cytochrome [Wenyingzhuangia sp. 2_MG-2023]MDO6737303.1 c-type cytochrome [Wenyingzhuangia sp. 2_MG-2023]MDO6801617.1 c-type cytochrome [Wenyingzhuangia sp. 1_MG-2023]
MKTVKTISKALIILCLQLGLIACKKTEKKYSAYLELQKDTLTSETQIFTSDPNILKFNIKNIDQHPPKGLNIELIKYGYKFLTTTSRYVGYVVSNPKKRYAGNNLACVNCHISGGTKAYAGSWIGVMSSYPAYRTKNGKVNDIYMRINGCMERSMNGRPLEKDSKEMQGVVEYFRWLNTDKKLNYLPQYKGFLKIDLPKRAADTIKGKALYNKECFYCHGTNGSGIFFDDRNVSKGYVYPPLWGKQSYNLGAGMAKLGTLAGFIKGNMPYGVEANDPKISDEDAYDIAAYVNTKQRPSPPDLEQDYPDRLTKGADIPYGPYDDIFPEIQHRIGPLQPIKRYYLQQLKERKK